MRALRLLGKIVIVLLAILGGLTVALAVTAGLVFNHLSRLTAAPTPDKAVLVFDLANGVIDALPESPLARIALNKTVALQDALRGLDAAATDDRVKLVLVRLGSAGIDFVHAQELGDEIASFRRSGKPVIAFAESFDEGGETNSRYLLATAASEIWMQPSGGMSLTGASLQVPFLKDTLDKLGITARMDHREEYKGAMNSLTETSMPAPQRANMQGLVDSLTAQLSAAIARNRRLDPAAAEKLVAGGPYSAPAAKAASLLDRLGYWDEVQDRALSQAGSGADTVDLSDYIAHLPDPPASAPKIAVIYGIGEVSLGHSRGSPLVGQATMGARTVADALHEAVDDSKIAGIIFRIDSPGGSYVAADTIWREVARARELHKPLVVSMGSLAASGGYFVAAPAAAIVAEPGTLTGSIGVFAGKFVIQDFLAKLGINVDSVAGTPNALAESMTRDYTPEQWTTLERQLDRIYDDFMSKVAAGRHLDKEAVHAVAKGQVWTGADAKSRGLVDELGGLAAATAAVKRLARIAPGATVDLEQYPPPSNDLQSALSSLTGGDSESRLLAALMSRLAEIAAPLLSPDQTLRAPLP
jgi:protease IV